ncbi:MAG: transglycosylase SLT domain-containing protein [Longimicrobiales bacterium]|nr:transglycosylase SLT domain-containing protein [Longimicrobiales bacterium]
MRYALVFGLMIAAVGFPFGLLDEGVSGPAPTVAPGPRAPDGVPLGVLEAATQKRFWRAARLLDDHLEARPDTAPATLLYRAWLDAGWENWPGVVRLLEGRGWMDTVQAGLGWELLGRARVAEGDPGGGAEALARYLEVGDPDREDRGVAELRLGLALSAGDDPDRALAAFDRAARLLPWFADWASFLAAEAAARAGRPAETDRRLDAAGDVAPEPWRIRLLARLMADDTLAARETALAATRTGTRARRAEAWAELGRLRLASGDTTRATEAFLRAMEVRTSAGAVDAARRLSELDPSPDSWRAIASVYRWHGNPRRAIEGYEKYLQSSAGDAGARAQARLELGRARFDAGRFRQAERGLLGLAEEDVSDGLAAEALYTAARAQYRQGRGDAGEATFRRLADRYPGTDAVARGLFLVADLKHDDLELDGPRGARSYYRQAADAAPDLNEAGLALMRLAGLAYLEGDYETALSVWEEYRTLHPRGRRIGQATYWAARALERLDRDSLAEARLREVRDVDPLSYYGLRAAERLGRPLLDIPMDSAPSVLASADTRVRAGVRRVDVLAALERRDDLVHEVERLRVRFQQATGAEARAAEYALAEALNERGYTLTGIGMGWDLYERTDAWNPRLLRIIYPFPYRSMIVLAARERELDPYLVAGVIRRESAFSSGVVSGAGAIGLMQIVPETGRALARAERLRPFDRELLTRPEINVHLGTRFFSELVDRFDAPLPVVLAAYNAGPTRATVWLDLPEADDPELFMERIPYGETRDYIRRVTLHQALYRALYPALDVGG